MKNKENKIYDFPLQETQRAYEEQFKSIDSIKQTIRTIFGASSLIVSLTSGLQLVSNTIEPDWVRLYQAGIVSGAVLYVLLIVLCILGMWPTALDGPILLEWNVLTTAFADMNEEDQKAKYLSSLLNVIEINSPKVKRLMILQRAALITLPVLVTALLLLAFIPRV